MTIDEFKAKAKRKVGFGKILMSNIDHKIHRTDETTGAYSGRDFYGLLILDNGQWHCLVQVYQESKKVVTADTLEQIMQLVSAEFGAD